MALTRGRGGRRGSTAVATLVAFIGMVAMVGLGLAMATSGSGSGAGGRGAPAPDPTHRASTPTPSPSRTTLGRSQPVHLTVPALGVDGKVSKIGLRKDKKTLQLPPRPKRAAWYDQSVTPGELGPSVLVGYIDAGSRGPGVFRRLDKLHGGNAIYLQRADGVLAAYRVDAVKSYRPDRLPMKKIYGGVDDAALRIVTCGGSMNRKQRPTNVVVYAHLVQVRES